MMNWQEWEISDKWASNAVCPDCGEDLIITHIIAHASIDDGTETLNGICIHCRKQYSVTSEANTLIPDIQVLRQCERIAELEERVARLEAIVKALTERKPLSLPDTPESLPDTPEAPPEVSTPLLQKYAFLLR